MDDQRIIALYNERNEQAIEETAAKYSRYCISIAYNILRDVQDAEEVVSDTWICAWNGIPPHQPRNLAAFLGTITRRRALDRYDSINTRRRGGGQVILALDELSHCIPDPDSQNMQENRELTELLNAFLHGLPSPERRVFVCRYWYFDSVDEIAKQFGFSKSKVKSMLYRTRSKLRKYLEKEGVVL